MSTPHSRGADTALLLTWDKTVPGRESDGLALFEQAIELYERLVATGGLESYELAFPEPHGRPLTALALLRGSAASIGAIQASEEFQALVTRAYVVVQGLSVSRAHVGAGIEPYLARYAEALEALGTTAEASG